MDVDQNIEKETPFHTLQVKLVPFNTKNKWKVVKAESIQATKDDDDDNAPHSQPQISSILLEVDLAIVRRYVEHAHLYLPGIAPQPHLPPFRTIQCFVESSIHQPPLIRNLLFSTLIFRYTIIIKH